MRLFVGRALDFLTAEPLRIRSFLRLVLIVLIALLIYQTHVEHWLEEVFIGVLAVTPSPRWRGCALSAARRCGGGSGTPRCSSTLPSCWCCASRRGRTIALYPIFFPLPISVAFLDSPAITGALGLSAASGYLLAWIVYATRDQKIGNTIPTSSTPRWAACWLTAAITALSYNPVAPAGTVLALLEVRRRLIAESMRADERHSRELSEQLHDGPLQNLLAARLDLDEVRENPSRRLSSVSMWPCARPSMIFGTPSARCTPGAGPGGLERRGADLAQRYEQR